MSDDELLGNGMTWACLQCGWIFPVIVTVCENKRCGFDATGKLETVYRPAVLNDGTTPARTFLRTRGNITVDVVGRGPTQIPKGALLTHFEMFDEGRRFTAQWKGEGVTGNTWEWRRTLGLDEEEQSCE